MSHSTRAAIIECLVEFTQSEAQPAFEDASWIQDFGLDSLRLFHALLHIEKRLGFAFADDELNLANIEDFSKLVQIVDRHRSEASVG